MYQFLDYFFLIFHTIFTLFNSVGWIWKKTRKIHLITVTVTALSWFILGIWFGWGYCFCTDWHWKIRESLGKPILSNSYVHFLIKELTGIDLNPETVDTAVLAIFIFCGLMSLIMNIIDFRKRITERNLHIH